MQGTVNREKGWPSPETEEERKRRREREKMAKKEEKERKGSVGFRSGFGGKLKRVISSGGGNEKDESKGSREVEST